MSKPADKQSRESLELQTLVAGYTPVINSTEFWMDQFDRCAMEQLGSLSIDSSDDQIRRYVSLCSRWAEAALTAAEERWSKNKDE